MKSNLINTLYFPVVSEQDTRISQLISVLTDKGGMYSADLKERAVTSLSNMAVDNNVRHRIAELGGLPPLIQLVVTGSARSVALATLSIYTSTSPFPVYVIDMSPYCTSSYLTVPQR